MIENHDYFGDIMADIAEASQKKLKTRISKFRKCNKDEQEKEKFFNKLGISFTINVPGEETEMEKMINIYSNPDGNITYSEYIYPDEENFSQEGISNEELESIVDDFSDFKLKLDNDGEIDEDSLDSFCSFTINLFNKNPEKKDDLITIYTTPDGSVLFAEYVYTEEENFSQIDITEKDLKVIVEAFSDYKLNME